MKMTEILIKNRGEEDWDDAIIDPRDDKKISNAHPFGWTQNLIELHPPHHGYIWNTGSTLTSKRTSTGSINHHASTWNRSPQKPKASRRWNPRAGGSSLSRCVWPEPTIREIITHSDGSHARFATHEHPHDTIIHYLLHQLSSQWVIDRKNLFQRIASIYRLINKWI